MMYLRVIFFRVAPWTPPRRRSWRKVPLHFPPGSAHVAAAFAFSAQVFFRLVFKGASSCFLSGYLPGPDKEVRLPAVSAFNQRAAFSMARLTYTVKRLSQHCRSRLCVKRQSVRGGDWKINGFMFFSCLSFCAPASTRSDFFYFKKIDFRFFFLFREWTN